MGAISSNITYPNTYRYVAFEVFFENIHVISKGNDRAIRESPLQIIFGFSFNTLGQFMNCPIFAIVIAIKFPRHFHGSHFYSQGNTHGVVKTFHTSSKKFPTPVQKSIVDCWFAKSLGWLFPVLPPYSFFNMFACVA